MSSSADHASKSTATTDKKTPTRPLTRGIYVPTPAFFHPTTEELDIQTTTRHALRLARAGVAGLAVQGSNGEAVHLLHAERDAITRATRTALDDAGFASMPLMVGCGAQSTYETVRLCRQAAAAGGDYALVLPPSYYSGVFDNGDVERSTVVDFFRVVADESPIPVVVYSYPTVTPGVDLSSDVLVALGRHGNIAGCKFTCGNMGKMGRVVAAFRKDDKSKDDNDIDNKDTKEDGGFLCFAGSADFTLPALAAGAAGVVGGLANIAPRACVRVFEAAERETVDGGGVTGTETVGLQDVVARGDWVIVRTGVVGVKAALSHFEGYGGWARRPLPRPDGERVKGITDGLEELMELERRLSGER